jgi:hypothetical protein
MSARKRRKNLSDGAVAKNDLLKAVGYIRLSVNKAGQASDSTWNQPYMISPAGITPVVMKYGSTPNGFFFIATIAHLESWFKAKPLLAYFWVSTCFFTSSKLLYLCGDE